MAWAYVKSANNIPASSSANTIAKAYGSAVSAASLLVATCTCQSGGTISFSDSVNGSWTATVKNTNDATNNQSVATSFFANTAAGTPTVTANLFGAVDFRGIIVTEYSGIATSTPEDGTAVGDVKAANTTHTSSNITVTQSGDLVYGFIDEDTAGTATISSTDVTQHDGSAGQAPTINNSVDIGAGDKTGPASGTTNVTFTFGTSQGAIIHARAFKAAAAGGAAIRLRFPSPMDGVGSGGVFNGNRLQ